MHPIFSEQKNLKGDAVHVFKQDSHKSHLRLSCFRGCENYSLEKSSKRVYKGTKVFENAFNIYGVMENVLEG